jgi:4-aminobutyrate aminotransferase-like enzyme/Ser/Thr protein kinase RdoA (MazF antagonist)
MQFSEPDLHVILKSGFDLAGEFRALPGEHDINRHVAAADGKAYLLKIHAPGAEPLSLDMQVKVLEHLAAVAPALPVSRQMRTGQDALLFPCGPERQHQARLLSWLPGQVWAKAQNRSSRTTASLGALLGALDHALASFRHAGANRTYGWDIAQAALHRSEADKITDGDKRATVTALLDHFSSEIEPRLARLPRQVIHNDANDYNLVVGDDGLVSGLLDFGDMVESHRIIEVAVACAYAMIGAEDAVGSVLPLVSAYHAANPLSEHEIDILFDLIKVRYAVSIVMASKQIREQPDNRYLLISQEDVWRELSRLTRENAALARARLRDACGFEPIRHAARILRWLESVSHDFAPVVKPDVPVPTAVVLDFSAAGADAALIATLDGPALDRYCVDKMADAAADLAIGRYGEDRTLYKGDAFETASAVRRTVHLGIDIFAPAGEVVYAPIAGTVAFTHDDDVAFGFGPTVLLEHVTDAGDRFWTLYGHLQRQSLAALTPGQAIARGEAFAAFGNRQENGQWPPHLHFQIVTDHLGLEGCMHGVGVGRDWQVWRAISPDPNVILGLRAETTAIVARAPQWLAAHRQQRIGRSLSIAYSDAPLKIVAARGSILYDEQGTAWLDMVNNVCHVGHCHPRVVAAAQRQMAALNTNSRYLHDTLVEYADRLTALFPAPLSVCFFVNSGSEANDLAIRLARAYTGQTGLITVDHAYHGHLTSLIDVSPYKFNGRGGGGRPPHVWVAEMPDPYRGRVRGMGSDAGQAYADDVQRQIAAMAGEGRAPALFFSEGILGTGGQIVPPADYLRRAYAHVRAAGGLCLADEVQVGFGRVGSHMWAFETQGVVPDIVTLGKPIGNGHPMAAVITTPAIANRFANGMEYFNTFGGNPVSAAIGLAVLDVIRDERLRHQCAVVGEALMAGARRLAGRHALIGDVRGLGLFNGIELVRNRHTLEPAGQETDAVIAVMKRDHHILLSSEGPYHNVLKIKPPAAFSMEDCDRFLAALAATLTQIGSPR